jgi:hypothetical protein
MWAPSLAGAGRTQVAEVGRLAGTSGRLGYVKAQRFGHGTGVVTDAARSCRRRHRKPCENTRPPSSQTAKRAQRQGVCWWAWRAAQCAAPLA